MAPNRPTPLQCPVTSSWRVPTPRGWLYLNPHDTRFLALSHPNPLTRPHAPFSHAGPTAESYTAAYNIASAKAAGYTMSTDARVHWHYVESVGPSERWIKKPAESRSVTMMGPTEGSEVGWRTGDWRTSGAEGVEGRTANDETGGSLVTLGRVVQEGTAGSMVHLAKVQLGITLMRAPVNLQGPSPKTESGARSGTTKPMGRVMLQNTPGNGIIPESANCGISPIAMKLDPFL